MSNTATSGNVPRYRDAEWLREQYWDEGKSLSTLAAESSCNSETIRRWMERHGIDRRDSHRGVPDETPYRDEDWLRTEYWDNERTASDIAADVGVSQKTILRWMQRHGIDRRSSGGSDPKYPDAPYTDVEWLREQYWEQERTIQDIADEVGLSDTSLWEWLDKHGIERRDGGGGRDKIPEIDLLMELRVGAEALGRAPKMRDMGTYGAYSAQVYSKRFGSWPDALDAAGIDPETGELVKSDAEVFDDE